MRHTVLWIGSLAAVMATSKMRHINIDVFTRFLPPRIRAVRDKIIYLATALATSVLGFAALKLVIDEREFGEKAFLNIGTWVLQAVLPLSFFLISYRSFFNMWCPREVKPMDWDEFGIESNGDQPDDKVDSVIEAPTDEAPTNESEN